MTSVFAKKVRRGLTWLLGLCLLAGLGLYANHRAVDYVADQLAVPDVEKSTSPEFVREALAYGDWVLPADATVLRAEREIIRDRTYRIAVRTSPAGLVFMLRQSRFPYAIDPCTPSCSLDREAVGQEAWFTSSSGMVMIREVTVYARDENTRIVHIEFSHF